MFKKEFHEGIEKLHLQIKEDENRYTKLCYRIHNITELHQNQLQYLQSMVENMMEENNEENDECIIEELHEKLRLLDTRIVRL